MNLIKFSTASYDSYQYLDTSPYMSFRNYGVSFTFKFILLISSFIKKKKQTVWNLSIHLLYIGFVHYFNETRWLTKEKKMKNTKQ